jgi:hypothetical protein
LAPGDLLFFNFSGGSAIDHVAMYVGPITPGGDDVVQASSPGVGIISSKKDTLKTLTGFVGFQRPTTPQIGMAVQTHSPVTLTVTDPNGYTISSNTLVTTQSEHAREIPGVLYYTEDSNGDDMVIVPTLKAGNYIVQVSPKPSASPADTYSLDITTGTGQTVTLAQNVAIANIPSSGDAVQSATLMTQAPNPVSATPPSGLGASQAFAFTFSEPYGIQNLGVVNILINNFLDGRQACYLAYSQPLNTLYLVPDSGSGLLPGAGLNSPGSVSNSQCTVTWGNSAVAGAGNALTLALTVGFTAGFGGNKVVYLAARDIIGNNFGWQALGVWQAPGAAQTTTTAVVGVAPTRGSGTSAAPFTFKFSDTKGYRDLGVMNILVNNFLDGRQACYLAYSQPLNVLYLVNDPGTALLPGQPLSAAGGLSNSQCTVTWGDGPVAASGNNLTLTLTIAFAPAFSGNRVFYLASRDASEANNTGWQAMGTWLVQ